MSCRFASRTVVSSYRCYLRATTMMRCSLQEQLLAEKLDDETASKDSGITGRAFLASHRSTKVLRTADGRVLLLYILAAAAYPRGLKQSPPFKAYTFHSSATLRLQEQRSM